MGDLSGANNKLDDSAAVQITGKIMVVAIIILFFVVVIVCFLHLYAKWFWWRVEGSSTTPELHNRRRRRRRFVFTAGQDPAIYGDQRRGLEPEVLRSIPVVVFQPEDFKDGLECAVCLSELAQGEKARLLPKCNHGFHVECIDMWFQSHSTCPLCRNPVASESFKSCCSSGVRENDSENNSQSSDSESSDAMSELDLESPNFPTNVLIWGNQTQVSSNGASLAEGGPSSSTAGSSSNSSSNSNSNNRRQGMLVIDIPREINPSSLSPSTSRFAEDDLKSPMTSRLKSFKRILSKKFSPRSPSSVDVEQGGRGQN